MDHPLVRGLVDIADFHLVAAETRSAGRGDVGGERVQPIIAAVVSGRRVGLHGTPEAAEDAPKRLARGLAQDVPERDVNP